MHALLVGEASGDKLISCPYWHRFSADLTICITNLFQSVKYCHTIITLCSEEALMFHIYFNCVFKTVACGMFNSTKSAVPTMRSGTSVPEELP